MTILTKPTFLKKPIADKPKDVEALEPGAEEDKQVYFAEGTGRRSSTAILCMATIALLVATTGFLCGLELYRECMRTDVTRYQAYCSIPVDEKNDSNQKTELMATEQLDRPKGWHMFEPQFRLMPVQWTGEPEPEEVLEPEIPMGESSDELVRMLREQFDIGDQIERISVYNGQDGGRITFIHDFTTNISGIVDRSRCFVMALERAAVLTPAALVLRIESRGGFDVSRARRAMRALLPPLLGLAELSRPIADACEARPAYRLVPDAAQGAKRKRSVEMRLKADYTHFSGRRVQEISIDNLAELLQYEASSE